MYKKVNRKTKFFNHVNRNVVYPAIFLNPSPEEGNKNTVQITELNSDGDLSEKEQPDNCHNNHSWSSISERSKQQEDDYKINKSARDKRRKNNDNENVRSKYNEEDQFNQFCTDFYGIDCYDRGERISTVNNPHSELFTILNNHRLDRSETSSDSNQYDEIKVVQCEDTKENDYWNSNDFYDRNVTYDNKGDADKRTVFIYALKNQRYLSEQDYELLNIPSKDSPSTTDDEEPSKDIQYSRRIATPIPTYIPRMNLPLSPSLPTVDEVSEPNKQASNNSDISTKHSDRNVFQRPLSGWFNNEAINTQNDKQSPGNVDVNYENNWQALSPRERRRLRNTSIIEPNKPISKNDPETQVYCEPVIVVNNKDFSRESHIESFEKQIDEIDLNEDEHANGIIDEKDQVSLSKSRECTLNKPLCNLHKPQIVLNKEIKTLKKNITDPIEKLNGNWIGPSSPDHDEVLEVYDYNVTAPEDIDDTHDGSQRTGSDIEICASERLFIRNYSLLKPAEWTQYLPLTGSVPSLHMSISVDTDFDTEKKSWFKRFLHLVNCCK